MNKIALYDKAWDSIFKLPRQVQKKVPEFFEKFRADSTMASIHLEPISTFIDPQLRTARLTKSYRAIIHAPTEGNLFHLLYIDNHDEAMDWARNKRFEWNTNTQSYQVFTIPAAEVREEIAQPATTPVDKPPDAFADYADEQLLAIGVPAVLLPSVRSVGTVEELEGLYDYLPIEALENLSLLLDGARYDTIIRDLKAGKVDSPDREVQESSPNNQRSFFELTDDDLLDQMLRGEIEKWKVFLHPSQQKLVKGDFSGAVKVTGGAGTGKTVAAVHRAKFLQEHGEATYEQPILFLTYTNSLVRNLTEDLASLAVDSRLVQLQSIESFVLDAARSEGILAKDQRVLDSPHSKNSIDLWMEVTDLNLSPFPPDFLRDEHQQVILHHDLSSAPEYYKVSRLGRVRGLTRKDRMAVWKLVEVYEQRKQESGYLDRFEVYNLLARHYRERGNKPFRHLIADELQDFSNPHLRLLRSLVPEASNDLFLVGDPLQKIYSGRIVFQEVGINIKGRRSSRLRINYRTTDRIRRSAIKVIKGADFSDFEGGVAEKAGYISLRAGEHPTYSIFKTADQEIDFVLNKLGNYLREANGEITEKDICIASRTRNSAKPFRSALHQQAIPYYDLIEDKSGTGRKDGVRISTFHNLKGLEFKVVFLVDVNESTAPYHPVAYADWETGEQEEYDAREKALLYVAMTRAVVQVHISGIGQASELIASS